MRTNSVWILSILISLSFFSAWFNFCSTEKRIRNTARLFASQQAEEAALNIDLKLRSVVPIHRNLVHWLATEEWTKQSISNHLCSILAEAPMLFGVGVAFRPHQFTADRRLYAPYCQESTGTAQIKYIEEVYDYTAPDQDWYQLPLSSDAEVWQEPHLGRASEAWIVNLTGPFHTKSNSSEPAGVAFSTFSLSEFRQMMAALDLGDAGYSFLVSKGGKFIVHPKESYLGKSVLELAEARDDDDLRQIAQAAGTGQAGSLDHFDELTGESSWMFYQPIATTDWTLVVVFLQDEMAADLADLHSQRPWLVALGVALVVCLAWLLLGGARLGTGRSMTPVVATITLVLIGGSVLLVRLELKEAEINNRKIVKMSGQEGLEEFLSDYDASSSKLGRQPAVRLPTGIFVQSVAFSGSNDVHLTGYLWQRYQQNATSTLEPGFIFPEAVHHESQEAFRRQENGAETIGWYFETTLRQKFDYKRYPFDSKQIWIRVWHREFDKNVVLVPDLESYQLTNPRTKPGLEEELIVAGWSIKSSFFGFKTHCYSTNFGLANYAGQDDFPELYFNILALRESSDSLIVHFVPIVVVAMLLFAMLASITSEEDKNLWLGFSFSSFLSGVSGLFFVLILSHIQLREEVPDNLVYLEWFYFLSYFAILATAMIGFKAAAGTSCRFITCRDCLIPRLLFWPTLAFFAFLISLMQFR